jgi:hypothetical protein
MLTNTYRSDNVVTANRGVASELTGCGTTKVSRPGPLFGSNLQRWLAGVGLPAHAEGHLPVVSFQPLYCMNGV